MILKIDEKAALLTGLLLGVSVSNATDSTVAKGSSEQNVVMGESGREILETSNSLNASYHILKTRILEKVKNSWNVLLSKLENPDCDLEAELVNLKEFDYHKLTTEDLTLVYLGDYYLPSVSKRYLQLYNLDLGKAGDFYVLLKPSYAGDADIMNRLYWYGEPLESLLEGELDEFWTYKITYCSKFSDYYMTTKGDFWQVLEKVGKLKNADIPKINLARLEQEEKNFLDELKASRDDKEYLEALKQRFGELSKCNEYLKQILVKVGLQKEETEIEETEKEGSGTEEIEKRSAGE